MPSSNVKRTEAANALRTVSPERAFYFYRGIGQPLGPAPRSLGEFATAVNDIDPACVVFHVARGDFESWFAMLGDKPLAGQAAALRGKDVPPDELRGELSSMVSARLDQLHRVTSSKR